MAPPRIASIKAPLESDCTSGGRVGFGWLGTIVGRGGGAGAVINDPEGSGGGGGGGGAAAATGAGGTRKGKLIKLKPFFKIKIKKH